MRHRKAGLKLNRTSSHRQAMFRNMVTSLFKYDSLKTTDAKAKELRRWADHLITLAKRGDLHARRQALAIMREKKVVHKLFETANERWGIRNGGYTRVIKLGRRPGDAAQMSMIQLVLEEGALPSKKKLKKPTEPPKETHVQEAAKTGVVDATETPAEDDASLEKAAEPESADETIAEVAESSVDTEDEEKASAAAEDASDQPEDASSGETEGEGQDKSKS